MSKIAAVSERLAARTKHRAGLLPRKHLVFTDLEFPGSEKPQLEGTITLSDPRSRAVTGDRDRGLTIVT